MEMGSFFLADPGRRSGVSQEDREWTTGRNERVLNCPIAIKEIIHLGEALRTEGSGSKK